MERAAWFRGSSVHSGFILMFAAVSSPSAPCASHQQSNDQTARRHFNHEESCLWSFCCWSLQWRWRIRRKQRVKPVIRLLGCEPPDASHHNWWTMGGGGMVNISSQILNLSTYMCSWELWDFSWLYCLRLPGRGTSSSPLRRPHHSRLISPYLWTTPRSHWSDSFLRVARAFFSLSTHTLEHHNSWLKKHGSYVSIDNVLIMFSIITQWPGMFLYPLLMQPELRVHTTSESGELAWGRRWLQMNL